jgi:alpha-methylacyl-CoA racemase
MTQPLDDIVVLDFSTLLPGPMATLMLAEAGADVIKLERPETGEDMRLTDPKINGRSLGYAVLNRSKKSLTLDLKSKDAVETLRPLIEKADVIVEQFRPGVMDRLGLGYAAAKAINPAIIYCSITGYGQTGPKRNAAGHDMNYVGDAGILSLSSGPVDQPVNPFALVADIGGGTFPAVVNILLVLRQRDKTGQGAHLDIAMAEGAFAFAYWAHAQEVIADAPIENGGERLTGGKARYRMYPAADGRQVIVGAIEEKFWVAFCNVIELPQVLRDDAIDPDTTIAEVARRLAAKPSGHWEPLFEAENCCCSVVKTPLEASRDPHFAERGIFDWKISVAGEQVTALPLPVSPLFRANPADPVAAPDLGAQNALFGLGKPES